MGRIPRSGEVINGRYTIEHLAGTGGMGQVYRARDFKSGGLVALKVMHDAEKLEIERFAREARVLATLSHPGIVRYIDSGTTPEGEPYLVMEWLAGETLSARLQRAQVTLTETLSLGRRVASALNAIHRRGVVHRDIKPSNLFLRNNAIDEVALIDFGTARRPVGDQKLTVTGTMLGTPGYIAPEQVYNVPSLDGRADIFSLGCVLYRCLSGQAPFRGHDALRMLLNGAPDQLPRLRELRPAIPPSLDDLVMRMLARSPDDRPPSGDVVASELLAIEESEPRPLVPRSGPRSVVSEIMSTERRLVSVIVVRPPERRPEKPIPILEREAQDRALKKTIERHRGKLEMIPGGSMLVVFTNPEAAPDLATRASRCALAMRNTLGAGAMVLITGREVLSSSLPESELLDRATDLLETTGRGATIRVDELTAALIGRRFDTGRTGLHLRSERRDPDPVRRVFGEPTQCIGRDPELAQLENIFDRCADERVPALALLTGATGVGKSCVVHTLLKRLQARDAAPALWVGAAEPLQVGAAFGLLAQVVRHALGITDEDPLEARKDKLRAWAARHPETSGPKLAELLGELVGAPLGSEPGVARLESMTLSELVAQIFLGFLRAEAAERPIVIVLEDLQWSDLPTIRLVDVVMGALSDQPVMVLAVARSEVHDIFPQLWSERSVQEVRLRKLSRRASEQLVRQALGDAVAEETSKALVERSEGHAAYLEEMIRAVTEGKGAETPATVVAMVQARLEKLDPEARRVLRAASVFGDAFWRGGVEALLGGGNTAAWLDELVEQDLIVAQHDARLAGEAEYRFRQPLVREAAYAMLTEGDRVAGHWLAGQWLEQAGETDATVLEEHFERCGRGG